jgi:uncharacterized protein (UPF0333 family)
MDNHNAKHFALQLGSLISLYLSLSFLLVLVFGIINILFPDAADYYWQTESARSSVRIGIAMVVVFFPTYLILTRTVNSLRRDAKNNAYLSLTKWLIYLSLLVGGGVLLIDLVVVIMTFLEGELSIRFVLKALAVVTVVGAAFYYYILDARGFWIKNEKKSVLFAIGTVIVVLVALGFGVANIETPATVREQKIDGVQINDLQVIQSRVIEYYTLEEALPESLSDITGGTLPTAPNDRAAYTYARTEKGFTLCAYFAVESNPEEFADTQFFEDKNSLLLNPNSWTHTAGDVCFDRVLTTLPAKS